MEKDLSQLTKVSKLFTEGTLQEILRQSSGEKNVTVTGWTFEPKAAIGDSYLSEVDRMAIHGESEGKPIMVRLVVKSLPKNIGRRKTYRSTDFFYNEITFYQKIVPEFIQFLESKGQKQMLVVPPCLSALADGENDYIALQDVRDFGYGPVARLETLTLEEMTFLLQGMANFHAVSFAYKDQNKEKFDKLADKLIETYFSNNHWDWYKNFHAISIRVTRDAMAKEYPDHPAEMKLKSHYEPAKKLWDKSVSFCSRRHAPTSVINQGDSWAPNFLMRVNENDGKKQALLLDFQLARVASPILDISFLIYACSNKELLDNHFDDMLKTYHSTLSNGIKALGSDPEKIYPWFLFEEEVKEQWIHGMNFAMEAIPFSMLDSSEAFDLNIIKGDEAVDIADIWQVQNIKTTEGRHRLADVIVHAHSRGFM
ncbi:uncharacterized protein [Venturia canescens]|nr:uncharacterized protein LOC122418913 isoform X2 [Venturia canescens]XP_043288979.1 uncharacterized protein LOC122418913 isoform X2 [Venturia canescens]XP_043288980.1 uncharacterized protein LOC122418913 isoform X2 [Venturia canescens]XP_043288981.1 uncharacterized protein LOC122418913 isoform X2 [Venturia canescens]XP_043288982.1 uncharacterized protein LOC122418913 isoform X2 [Venturia canescens]